MAEPIRVGILGASGYTGADLVRLLARHPRCTIAALTANQHAGQPMAEVYPHLRGLDLPGLVTWQDVDWASLDVVFCALPHGTTQEIVAELPAGVRVIDLSADFRLRDPASYAAWYGREHAAPALQKGAVYGLTEHYRDALADADLVACPGCYPTATLLALIPLVRAGLVSTDDLIVDAKSGVTGAGRKTTQGLLFAEVGEGMHPYGVGRHRHAPEIEQELGAAAGTDPRVTFTPHLVPMNRGELVTCHVKLAGGADAGALRDRLRDAYSHEPFVRVLEAGETPATRTVRGANAAEVAVYPDRAPGRAIVVATIDNLVKGASGQAVQNMNVACGFPETDGLAQLPLFP